MRFQEELPTLSAFADQAAVAIEYARLIEENRRRAETLAETNDELEKAKARLADLLGRRTEQLVKTRRDLRAAKARIQSHFGYGPSVGNSAAMRALYAVIERVKETDVPVLILGESGTGKEVVARAIHETSHRAKAPYIGINCGAIPANLLESELFGHVRGAFTGADRDRKGVLQQAHGGTLLLDEIGELPVPMQAGLLRVLQERCVRPLGSNDEVPIDVRILAATNRDLGHMVTAGTFREDLFYRLNVVPLTIPPLRDRRGDVALLVDHFLGLFEARYKRDRKALAREALARLVEYDFPGNVRELEHVLLQAWLMSEGDEILEEDVIPLLATRKAQKEPRAPSLPPASVRSPDAVRDDEKSRILDALSQAGWNKMQAAKRLGIPRRTFYRRLKEYGIQ
jgi:transcriptional regulator with PAS, ATPase and Fis domain